MEKKSISIANAFLNKIPPEIAKSGNGMNKVKLQKLLFFAQEEYLFRNGEPLFEDKIVAWKRGPVVYDVWCHFNGSEIGNSIEYYPRQKDLIKFTKQVKDVIEYIWDIYGDKDEWYLEGISHSYKIWKDTFDGTNNPNNIISVKEIKEYKQEIEDAIIDDKKQLEKAVELLGI